MIANNIPWAECGCSEVLGGRCLRSWRSWVPRKACWFLPDQWVVVAQNTS